MTFDAQTASKMDRRSFCASVALFAGLCPSVSLAQANFDLLTPEEIAEWRTSKDGKPSRNMSMLANDGPKIRVASPNGFSLRSPVDFDVSIEPRGGVPVAMGSLRIDYRIGPVWKNVTQRIVSRGSVSGTRLRAQGANLPSGRHTVRLTVADTSGRETVAVVKFAVA